MDTDFEFTFTVFTPSYNRASTLPRVYESLLSQTFRDFEWIIVDDGSTDDTPRLVNQWKERATFPIRYYRQENGGKHRAFNFGVRQAKGRLFLTIDSDDAIVPEALETLYLYWERIPTEIRHTYSAVTGLCVNAQGDLIGNAFPTDDYLDSNSIEIHAKYGVTGEKCGFQRTDLLREYPFPEIEGEKFIPESIVWNRLGLKYKTRYINRVLRIYYENAEDGLTVASVRVRSQNPVGVRLYYKEYLELPLPKSFESYFRNLVNYVRFSFHGQIGVTQMVKESPVRVLAVLVMPLGFVLYITDRLGLRKL